MIKPAVNIWRRAKHLFVLGFAALILVGCGDEQPLNTFEPEGPHAQDIDLLMRWLVVIMAVVAFAVAFVVLYIVIKNRVHGDDLDPNDLPVQNHGNPLLEVAWTMIPGLILVGIAIPTAATIWRLEEKNEPNELDVMVIGQQWWWEYRYDVDDDGFFQDANGDGVVDELDETWPLELSLDPDDVVVANELVIPAGQQTDLYITSRDVIHSYWIPRLNGKRDAVPGRIHTWAIEPFAPGKFTGWCTEFCGLSHARMRMSVIALEESEFETWLANQQKPAEVPADSEAAAGRELFAQQCTSCHVIDDAEMPQPSVDEHPLVANAAPNLTHFATRTVFAGAIYNQYQGPGVDANDNEFDVNKYLDLPQLAEDVDSVDDFRWNEALLKDWIRNAPEMKDMSPDDGRGMIAFPQLTEEQLDQIVAYLATLD